MAIDFPSSPTTGQSVTVGGVTWTWDGVKWTTSGSAGPAMPLAMNDNRIINGDMRIDQRNNGASGTAIGYTIDRWNFGGLATKGTWGQAAVGTAVPGFAYALGFSSNSAYTLAAGDFFAFTQPLEGDAVTDFAWGTANAQPVILSFWARSSLTGTFGGSIRNYAGNRSYPFTYALTAGVWAKVVITIPGDTGGTWVMSGNAGAVYVGFAFGCGATYSGPANAWASANYITATGAVSVVGTNAANFYVTGVKLEVGSVATPFNRQSLAKSMADCQRYFEKSYDLGNAIGTAIYNGSTGVQVNGLASSVNTTAWTVPYKVSKRTVATVNLYSPVTGAVGKITWNGSNDVNATVASSGENNFLLNTAPPSAFNFVNFYAHWTASAEL